MADEEKKETEKKDQPEEKKEEKEEEKIPVYDKIVLKLTGKTFSGTTTRYNRPATSQIVREIKSLVEKGVKIVIVVGGGNDFRGRSVRDLTKKGFSENKADYMGMSSTVKNALWLEQMFKIEGLETPTMSAIEFKGAAYFYTPEKASVLLRKKDIIIVGGGIGKPYHTTDYAAVSCARDLEIAYVFKGTKVDGLYNKNPSKEKKGIKLIPKISYRKAIAGYADKKFEDIFDLQTLELALSDTHASKIEIRIFNISQKGNLTSLVCGEKIGTIIVP